MTIFNTIFNKLYSYKRKIFIKINSPMHCWTRNDAKETVLFLSMKKDVLWEPSWKLPIPGGWALKDHRPYKPYSLLLESWKSMPDHEHMILAGMKLYLATYLGLEQENAAKQRNEICEQITSKYCRDVTWHNIIFGDLRIILTAVFWTFQSFLTRQL